VEDGKGDGEGGCSDRGCRLREGQEALPGDINTENLWFSDSKRAFRAKTWRWNVSRESESG
jgi:hypothetical protein